MLTEEVKRILEEAQNKVIAVLEESNLSVIDKMEQLELSGLFPQVNIEDEGFEEFKYSSDGVDLFSVEPQNPHTTSLVYSSKREKDPVPPSFQQATGVVGLKEPLHIPASPKFSDAMLSNLFHWGSENGTIANEKIYALALKYKVSGYYSSES